MKPVTDIRHRPLYPVAEAARILSAPSASVRLWIPGINKHGWLSFVQLVEAYIIQTLRARHRMSNRAIKKSLAYLRKYTGNPCPLAMSTFSYKTDGACLFFEHLGKLTNATDAGQLEWKELVNAFLSRVEYGSDGVAMRFFPFTRGYEADGPRHVLIDPRFNFGRPCIASKAISTAMIARRMKAGESHEELAKDYGCSESEIDEAIRAELPARRAA